MDIKQFKEKLESLEAIGASGAPLTLEKIRDLFKGMDLDRTQMSALLQYLKTKGLMSADIAASSVTSASDVNAESAGSANNVEAINEFENFPGTRVPLTAEEKHFMEGYLQDLEESADSSLVPILRTAADIAAEFNCEEIALADLIQEAALAAVSVPADSEDSVLKKAIYDGICAAVNEQLGVMANDRGLVDRVEKLDRAIKDLTDEGETMPAFTAAELAVILDTGLDELKSILRLTGDE